MDEQVRLNPHMSQPWHPALSACNDRRPRPCLDTIGATRRAYALGRSTGGVRYHRGACRWYYIGSRITRTPVIHLKPVPFMSCADNSPDFADFWVPPALLWTTWSSITSDPDHELILRLPTLIHLHGCLRPWLLCQVPAVDLAATHTETSCTRT